MEQNKIEYFNINLSFKDLIFLLNQIIKGRSYMRTTHNLFLKKKNKCKISNSKYRKWKKK